MTFIEEQTKKEITAAKRVGRGALYYLVIFWGLIGLAMLAGATWPLGLIFIAAAGYVLYRMRDQKKDAGTQQ